MNFLQIKSWPNAILRTYAIVLFSQKKWLGVLLLFVSFLNPVAGMCGIISVCAAILIAEVTHLNQAGIHSGLYSFNALMVGVGMGTFYETGFAFYIVLFTAVLLSVILSSILAAWFGKYGLPFLSLPFVFTFWLVLLATKEFSYIGLSQRNVYWLNEMYAAGGQPLVSFFTWIENLPMPDVVGYYFRALSALFFQSNVLGGMIICVGLLFFSRIHFTLSILGFVCAYGFNYLTGGYASGINYYNLGSNYMMVALAIGGFFSIPSNASYLWAVWSIPLTSLLVIGLGKIFGVLLLPTFSLPMCLIVIAFIFFMKQRMFEGKLKLAHIQHYSPEVNRYLFLNGQERWKDLYYFHLFPPFLGEWAVTQGYDGSITHKGDWSKALDFSVLDEEMKTYSGAGVHCEDFYCFNKPVLAPCDGIVEEIIDNVDDNAIGEVNTKENWGNTIVIRHWTGLYTKMSHLRKNSFRVKKGDFIHRGDIVALCGNSGRSPEPHLHFQVQSFPHVGSSTIEYPLAYYVVREHKKIIPENFSIPKEGQLISSVEINSSMSDAFRFQPGFKTTFRISENGIDTEETWEVFTDAWNHTYIWSKEKKSTGYFVNNGTVFYFTGFYGDKSSLLYTFYLSCYRVMLSIMNGVSIKDSFPLHLLGNSPRMWLQDFVCPFFIFMKQEFSIHAEERGDSMDFGNVVLHSQMKGNIGKAQMDGEVLVVNGKIEKIMAGSKEAVCVA